MGAPAFSFLKLRAFPFFFSTAVAWAFLIFYHFFRGPRSLGGPYPRFYSGISPLFSLFGPFHLPQPLFLEIFFLSGFVWVFCGDRLTKPHRYFGLLFLPSDGKKPARFLNQGFFFSPWTTEDHTFKEFPPALLPSLRRNNSAPFFWRPLSLVGRPFLPESPRGAPFPPMQPEVFFLVRAFRSRPRDRFLSGRLSPTFAFYPPALGFFFPLSPLPREPEHGLLPRSPITFSEARQFLGFSADRPHCKGP